MKLQPKKENRNVGFHYTVSDATIEAFSKLTTLEIVNWVEETARFIYELQTPEERKRMRKAKNFKW